MTGYYSRFILLLELLRTKKVTATEVGLELKMKADTARDHLNLLVKMGMARLAGSQKIPGKRGDPAQLYELHPRWRND